MALPEDFGKYTLLSRLGSGGMAEVFLARTQSIGGFEKLLAIKRLLPFCTQDQETVDLLADEARITVRLTHPNIVQVFDFGRVAESYYIAMEYVDGLDLKSLIRIDELSSTPMDLQLALYVTTSVLEALEFAHVQRDSKRGSLGIIHRDVSPHNVLISRHGQVKLTDFGVARAAISSHVSRVGDIRGKFSYMPPEQVCGGEIDQRVDIFAAGAVLYELLSGKQPYRAASAGEQLQLLRCEMHAPSQLRPGLPRDLDAICMRALDKQPERRFGSAGEFAAALRQLTMRELGASLPPTSALSDLVEKRLAEVAALRPNRTEVMVLADYSATDDSLIAQSPPPPLRRRQTVKERAITDASALSWENPAPASLRGLPTDIEMPISAQGTLELDETVVAFRPSASNYERAPAPSRPPQATPAPARPREPRPERPEQATAPQPIMTDEAATVISGSPFDRDARARPESRFEDTFASLRLSDLDMDAEEPQPPASRRRQGAVQIIVVLVFSFLIGLVLAVALATW